MARLIEAALFVGQRVFWMANGAVLALALGSLVARAPAQAQPAVPPVAQEPAEKPQPHPWDTAVPQVHVHLAPSVVTPVLPPPRPMQASWERGCRAARATGMARDEEGRGLFLTQDEVDTLLAQVPPLMHGGRLVPESRDGRVVGARLFGVRAGSTLSWLGFENGDLLLRINGQEVASPEQALGAYATMRRSDRVTVLVERRGQLVWLDYFICG